MKKRVKKWGKRFNNFVKWKKARGVIGSQKESFADVYKRE